MKDPKADISFWTVIPVKGPRAAVDHKDEFASGAVEMVASRMPRSDTRDVDILRAPKESKILRRDRKAHAPNIVASLLDNRIEGRNSRNSSSAAMAVEA